MIKLREDQGQILDCQLIAIAICFLIGSVETKQQHYRVVVYSCGVFGVTCVPARGLEAPTC
jgi:hypothetical protein